MGKPTKEVEQHKKVMREFKEALRKGNTGREHCRQGIFSREELPVGITACSGID